MKQYSQRTAVIHWLIFVLFIVAFFLGHELDESKDLAQKLSIYPMHFIIGDLVLLLTIAEQTRRCNSCSDEYFCDCSCNFWRCDGRNLGGNRCT